MRRYCNPLTVLAALIAGATLALALRAPTRTEAADEEKGPHLVHNVFFTLKDSTAENKKKLIDACNKYLTKHPGEVYYAAGPIVEDLKREVNDTGFDVALTIVFRNKAAHDQYQDARRHLEFIDKNKALWKKVRVFDSYVSK
jgi:hypothetical protein